jgi:hypothetical protein
LLSTADTISPSAIEGVGPSIVKGATGIDIEVLCLRTPRDGGWSAVGARDYAPGRGIEADRELSIVDRIP